MPRAKFKHATREQWLTAASKALVPLFKGHGYTVPKVKLGCGFTSQGRRGNRVGECWDANASVGKHHEIFIRASLIDPLTILEVVAHEMSHAVVGLKAGHGHAFKKCATTIGLVGKMNATKPGPKFIEWSKPILKALGNYPHDAFNDRVSSVPKKATYLMPFACPTCAYRAWTTAKHIDASGAPLCPVCRVSLRYAGKK